MLPIFRISLVCSYLIILPFSVYAEEDFSSYRNLIREIEEIRDFPNLSEISNYLHQNGWNFNHDEHWNDEIDVVAIKEYVHTTYITRSYFRHNKLSDSYDVLCQLLKIPGNDLNSDIDHEEIVSLYTYFEDEFGKPNIVVNKGFFSLPNDSFLQRSIDSQWKGTQSSLFFTSTSLILPQDYEMHLLTCLIISQERDDLEELVYLKTIPYSFDNRELSASESRELTKVIIVDLNSSEIYSTQFNSFASIKEISPENIVAVLEENGKVSQTITINRISGLYSWAVREHTFAGEYERISLSEDRIF